MFDLTLKINTSWSEPIPIAYGKDILIKFSKEYCLVSVMVKGDDEKHFLRTILGSSHCTIHAYLISHIKNPMILMKTEFEPYLQVSIEIKEPDLKVI